MGSGQDATTQPAMELADTVQAHIGRASQFADGHTRNWTLFLFFRILPEAEFKASLEQLVAVLNAEGTDGATKATIRLKNAKTVNAGLLDQALDEQHGGGGGDQEQRAPDEPAQAFLDWLKVLTAADLGPVGATIKKSLLEAGLPESWFQAGGAPAPEAELDPAGSSFGVIDAFSKEDAVEPMMGAAIQPLRGILANPDSLMTLFARFGRTAGEAGREALSGGLLKVCIYELLRQCGPAWLPAGDGAARQGITRSERAAGTVSPPLAGDRKVWDTVPVNVTFTHSGLTALKLNDVALASFPDAFKEGMAARAQRLGDTGPSAPEHWEGALGLRAVHGYLTGGFLVGSDDNPVNEKQWQRLRDDVRAFNECSQGRGEFLRFMLARLFQVLGLEILHIEFGEDPYDVDADDQARRLKYRKEHFGFRDGISQPFDGLGLADPRPGGGTPGRNGTWSPIALGEIFLDQPDEDGNYHQFPAHPLLRRGSTFLVFRKLEQDVAGFRIFLAKQAPRDPQAQTRLAAQFMGRWQNGTSLVLAPDAPLELGDDKDGLLNNFRYVGSDPLGRHCPLGAHVRRSNPRDIGGTNDVRRHRILRRSIGYGGRLLPEEALGDGNKRGLLFVAANARLDLQFEVIQAHWLNRGELLGQAGLGRCPVTGANDGGLTDAFLEAGKVAPVTGLPRFVVTRGGDYFFAPGLDALRAIANGCKFEVGAITLPYYGFSMGDAVTPALFDDGRLVDYAGRMLAGRPSVLRVRVPDPSSPKDPGGIPVAFVGQLTHVKQVLSMRLGPAGAPEPDRKIINSVTPYHITVQRLSRGQDMLVSTELGSPTEARRKKMTEIVNAAWSALGADVLGRLAEITKQSINAALRRTGPSRRIDLVHDLAAVAVYDVVTKLFGAPGPDWVTELAIALPFSHQHVGELQPDWLSAAQKKTTDNPGLATLQVWSILLLVDIVGNYQQQPELAALSRQGASEFMTHIDTLLAVAKARRDEPEKNLVAALVHLESTFVTPTYTEAEYYTDVRMLLLELVASAIANIPTTFGTVMDAVLKYAIPLPVLMPYLLRPPAFLDADQSAEGEDGVARLVYETCRINKQLGILMRTCEQDDVLPDGAGELKKGEWVGALVAAANFDPRPNAFPRPMVFSLKPFLPGPPRAIANYLLFGVSGGGRHCWGRDRLALYMLKECTKAAARLQLLQRVAGGEGELKKLAQVNIGLSARFAAVLPDWTPPSA